MTAVVKKHSKYTKSTTTIVPQLSILITIVSITINQGPTQDPTNGWIHERWPKIDENGQQNMCNE